MNKVLCCALLCLFVNSGFAQSKNQDSSLLQPIEIIAVRASDNMPVTQKTLSKKEIEKNNVGYDLPFIINQTPSVQVNSDAGNGIGYTGIRIRGSDATRINVTINGIPFNDAESQGTFFVDIPDIASSANSIQIQRGVGSSSVGSGAFGGSININTNEIDTLKNFSIGNNFGSFNTIKNSIIANTGLINKHFIFSGRMSNINSDGYIDRSQSKLQSLFSSIAYVDSKQSLRFNLISGKELTHAAWDGIDEYTLQTNRTYNYAGTEKTGEPYDNQIDNYKQSHYQLFYNRKINSKWKYNITGFLIKGKGYWEQYKAEQAIVDYGLPEGLFSKDTSDMIIQSWLDNQYYGVIGSLHYSDKKNQLVFNVSKNRYTGDHFGILVNSVPAVSLPENLSWYKVNAFKNENNFCGKWNYALNNRLQAYADVQFRNVHYQINGFKNNPNLKLKNTYNFLNPKLGITFHNRSHKVYFSFGQSSKEPNRDDFEKNTSMLPKAEHLNDYELGYQFKASKTQLGINLFYMDYTNQLIPTGAVNEYYEPIRINIENSYRAGIECEGKWQFNKWLKAEANISLSRNKLKNFKETLYKTTTINNTTTYDQVNNLYASSDIAYSPSVIFSSGVEIIPLKHTTLSFQNKYVGKQYLDNTSDENRRLADYFVQDVKVTFQQALPNKSKIELFVKLNNIFSRKYEPNGYTYSAIDNNEFTGYKDVITNYNYYYPMALFNWMTGIQITL